MNRDERPVKNFAATIAIGHQILRERVERGNSYRREAYTCYNRP